MFNTHTIFQWRNKQELKIVLHFVASYLSLHCYKFARNMIDHKANNNSYLKVCFITKNIKCSWAEIYILALVLSRLSMYGSIFFLHRNV